MSLLTTTGLHHVRITCTDLARSRAFYEDVLGFTVAAESPGDPSDPVVRADPFQLFGGVVFATNGILFGLRPVAEPGDSFESTRVGLDHISFAVAISTPRSSLWRAQASRTGRSSRWRTSASRSCRSTTRTAYTWN